MVAKRLPPLRPVVTALCVLAFLLLAAGVDYWLGLVVLLSFLAGLGWRWLRPPARRAWALAGAALLGGVVLLFFVAEYWRRPPLVAEDTLPIGRVTRYEVVVTPLDLGCQSFRAEETADVTEEPPDDVNRPARKVHLRGARTVPAARSGWFTADVVFRPFDPAAPEYAGAELFEAEEAYRKLEYDVPSTRCQVEVKGLPPKVFWKAKGEGEPAVDRFDDRTKETATWHPYRVGPNHPVTFRLVRPHWQWFRPALDPFLWVDSLGGFLKVLWWLLVAAVAAWAGNQVVSSAWDSVKDWYRGPPGTTGLDDRPRQAEPAGPPAAPDWLAARGARLVASRDGRSWVIYFDGGPQYLVRAVPARGQLAGQVTQTVNGSRIDAPKTYVRANDALAGGLEVLRQALGW